jgi:hypothetical protein
MVRFGEMGECGCNIWDGWMGLLRCAFVGIREVDPGKMNGWLELFLLRRNHKRSVSCYWIWCGASAN